MSDSHTGFTGWRFWDENPAALLARGQLNYHLWRKQVEEIGYDWEFPEEIDPRGYLQIHNQGAVGSCQGQSLADSCEVAHYIEAGEVVELSRAYSYLASQEKDNLLGRDNGSTLEAGSKVAAEGIPLESDFQYTADYTSILNTYRQRKTDLQTKARAWRFSGETPLSSYDDIFTFLKTRSGAVHIGIMWGLPDAWEIRSYSPGGGGHAVVFGGYLKVASWPKPGILLKNSWGTSWGRDGWAIIHPDAVDQMCRAKWSVFIGRSTPQTPKPRVVADI